MRADGCDIQFSENKFLIVHFGDAIPLDWSSAGKYFCYLEVGHELCKWRIKCQRTRIECNAISRTLHRNHILPNIFFFFNSEINILRCNKSACDFSRADVLLCYARTHSEMELLTTSKKKMQLEWRTNLRRNSLQSQFAFRILDEEMSSPRSQAKPMHPQKLTVWCGLWSVGVIGP